MIENHERDFLIGNARVVIGAFRPILDNGAVAVSAGRILDVGETSALRAKYTNFKFFDAAGSVCLPGLINSHTHLPMGFFRGLGHGKKDMIESFLFPAEKNLSAELTEPLSYSYLIDGLRAGVTTFVDHYYFSQGVGKALERLGVRGWIGETVADLGGAFPGIASFERAVKLIESKNFSSLIKHCIAPHAADTVSASLLKQCADYARANKLPLHMHLSQSAGELARVKARDGVSPVLAAKKAGALWEQSLVAHLTSASDEDLKIIKDTGATLAYCPSSTILYDHLANIKLASALEIPFALGTDCPASNDSADCLTELKFAGLIGRHAGIAHQQLSPDHLLAMSTINPARALGAERDVGSLEKGKVADLILLRCDVSALPAQNLLANIIYSMGSRDVTHVLVNGAWRLWNQSLVGINEKTLRNDYLLAIKEINQRLKKTSPEHQEST